MSGPIRQVLGPARARTKKLIEKEPRKLSAQPNLPFDDQLRDIADTRISLRHDIDKLQNSVDLLVSKDRDWCTLLQSVAAADKDKEEKLYSEAVDSESGHFALIVAGQDKLSELKSMVDELNFLFESLSAKRLVQRQDAAPSSGGQATASAPSQPPMIKLPMLDLKKFEGDSTTWTPFWNFFQSSVDGQPISNVQKFSYLLASVSGPAASAIGGLPITDGNYQVAVDILKGRFGKKSVIIDSLFAKLQNLRVVGNKTKELRIFLDTLDVVLRQLEALGEQTEQSILINLIRGKMSSEVLMELQKMKPLQDEWTVKLIRDTLRAFVNMQEDILRVSQLSLKPSIDESSGGSFGRKDVTHRKPTRGNGHQQQQHNPSASSFGAGASGGGSERQKRTGCVFCDGDHAHSRCTEYRTPNERYARLKQKEGFYCFRCLKSGHSVNNCTSKSNCFLCKSKWHHGALCKKPSSPKTPSATGSTTAAVGTESVVQEPSPSDQSLPKTTTHANEEKGVNVGIGTTNEETKAQKHRTKSSMLLTATTKIRNSEDPDSVRSSSAQLFLDCGSQRSFITTALAKKLHLLSDQPEELTLYTFGNSKPQYRKTQIVQFDVILQNGSSMQIIANAMDHLTSKQQRLPLCREDRDHLENSFEEKFFADSLPTEAKVFYPDVIIGEDYFWDFVDDAPKMKLPSGLFVIPSSLGLLLGGKQQLDLSSSNSSQEYSVSMETMMNQSLCELNLFSSVDSGVADMPNLEDFWSLESVGITDPPDVNDDDAAVQHFNDTVRFENGRYFVSWPWKSGVLDLPDNKDLALKRFNGLVSSRFKPSPVLVEKYSQIINDQTNKMIVETVDSDVKDGRRFHYLPHHPIITPQKSTTKVRIVFDASARSKGQLSLNDCLLRGQVLLPDLCGLLLRFRLQPIAIGSDVEKAFLTIGLEEPDRDVTRFWWFKDPSLMTTKDNLQIYRFRRVPFGIISSPFLLSATVKFHLSKWSSPVADLISENIYVDNVILGVSSVEEAVSLYKESKEIFQKASMNLREWMSNSKEFIDQIPEHDRDENPVSKVLGLLWNKENDTLLIKFPKPSGEMCTKRKVLKTVASVFDPLGFVSPALLPGKLLIQELWKRKLDWDEQLPPDLLKQWTAIQDEFMDVPVRRFIEFCPDSPVEIHIFVDASAKAFAAVAYLRQEVEEDFKVHLMYSKTRVAPVKQKVTIPRLELLALLIGGRMTHFLEKSQKVSISQFVLWSDSECCLHWLKSIKLLARFVENRLRDIKKLTSSLPAPVSFNYVPSSDNPADCASRGVTVSELINDDQWWYGPEWLKQKVLPVWNLPPVTQEVLDSTEAESRKTFKPAYEVSINAVQSLFEKIPVNIQRFSSLKKLLNTTVYCLRFIKAVAWKFASAELKTKHPFFAKMFEPIQKNGPLLCKELKMARHFWDSATQHQKFPDVVHSLDHNSVKRHDLVKQLGLTLDGTGVLRCHGRLVNSMLPESAKFPKLLPHDDPYTKLVIREAHESSLHSGTQQTLADIRKEYWIPKGRLAVRKVLSSCVVCRKMQGGPYKLPDFPALPSERVNKASPFEYTGLDYIGPVWCKVNGEKQKTWICLLTCLVTRAVHLELVMDMTAQEFLNALRRFIARRGPRKIMSDNAPQFKLVSDTFQKAWRELITSEDVISYCTSKAIEWQFITPFAPWQGGIYERMVGLTKSAFKKAVGRKLLQFQQLITLLTEVEAVLNSRPLSYVYADLDSPMVLRPVNFLLPHGSIGAPAFDEDPNDPEYRPKMDASDKLLKFWKSSHTEVDKFWDFWQDEYLASLREKTQTEHPQSKKAVNSVPKEDDVVLIHEEMIPRGSWKLGKIQKLNKGKDGQVRSAEVLTPNKTVISRPLNRLYPLEVSSVLTSFQPKSFVSTERSSTKQSTSQHSSFSPPKLQYSLLYFALIFSLWGRMVDSFAVNRTYVVCSGGRNGHALHIPKTIHCQLPEQKPLRKKQVKLWVQRDEPMRTPAYRCYLHHHSIFTRTGFLGSKGIVGETSVHLPVSSNDCRKAVRTKSWKSENLTEVSQGFWTTNKALIVAYKYCCYDATSGVVNFVIEEGEAASIDGKHLVSDLQDLSSCKPTVGFCHGLKGMTIWNGSVFEEKCSYRPQGIYTAILSGISLVIEKIQGAFSYSGLQHPHGTECIPQKAFYADQGGVFVEFLDRTPDRWLKLAEKAHLIEVSQKESEDTEESEDEKAFMAETREDLFNYKNMFLYAKLVKLERQQFSLVWHQLCLLKQGQLNNALQLLRIDSTLGLRALVGRDDIHAEWNGEVVMFWRCRNVTPAVIHISGNVNGTCYQYTPVQIQIDDRLLFVSPGSRDLVKSSPIVDCNHDAPQIFRGNDGKWYSVKGQIQVTELPLEIHWKGVWTAFTFDAPSLFQNRIAALFSSFSQPRFNSFRLHQMEMTLDKLVNYTASMSLDPAVISYAISGVGKGIGHIISGTGFAVGHVISGVSSGVENLVNGLLKGPLQLILNILIILFIIIGSLFGLIKLGQLQCVKRKLNGFMRRKPKKFQENIELLEVKCDTNNEDVPIPEVENGEEESDHQQVPSYQSHYIS